MAETVGRIVPISGFEYRTIRPATARRLKRLAEAPSAKEKIWILARAAAFVRDDEGHERPAFNYPTLARNFTRARRKISAGAIRRFVLAEDPGLYEARAIASTNRPRKTGPHWLLDAHAKIVGGKKETAVMAAYGYQKI